MIDWILAVLIGLFGLTAVVLILMVIWFSYKVLKTSLRVLILLYRDLSKEEREKLIEKAISYKK